MDYDNYLNKKIEQVAYLYDYDLLNDFLQDEYKDDDYLYNLYSSCIKEIECTKLPNCIYELLWGWTKQNGDNCCDVMNSFSTYMNKIVKSIIDDDQSLKDAFMIFKEITGNNRQNISKKLLLYFIRNHELKEKISKELVDMIQLAKWVSTIGNFILLPETKRGERGENVYKNGKAKDRMDVYLNNLKNFFESIGDEKAFSEYINRNYLWDYVDKNYEVISLFLDTDDKKFEKGLPSEPKCYVTLAKNIIKNIKRRGMFMEIIIRLSIEAPKQFEQVKDTKKMSSYEEVIKKIEIIKLSDKLKNLIEDF